MIPSILIPGTLCDARVFEALSPGLAEPHNLDYREHASVAVAARGLLSAVPQGSLGIAFSLGGWILLEMLRLAPDRFVGAVLISGNAFPDAAGNAKSRRVRVERGRDIGLRHLIDEQWSDCVGPGSLQDSQRLRLLQSMAEDLGHEVHARQAEMNLSRPDQRDVVEHNAHRIVAIVGGDDKLCPRDRYLALQNVGIPLHTLVGVGHYVPIEEPVAAMDLIRRHYPDAAA